MSNTTNSQGPQDKQPVGYNEQGRGGGDEMGDTEQAPTGDLPGEEASQQDRSSEGEPGRAASESTGGQKGAGDVESSKSQS